MGQHDLSFPGHRTGCSPMALRPAFNCPALVLAVLQWLCNRPDQERRPETGQLRVYLIHGSGTTFTRPVIVMAVLQQVCGRPGQEQRPENQRACWSIGILVRSSFCLFYNGSATGRTWNDDRTNTSLDSIPNATLIVRSSFWLFKNDERIITKTSRPMDQHNL